MISISNLSLSYGSRVLFENVNLILVPGNRYAVVGANGAGKSSFFRLLTRNEEPSTGDISIVKRSKVGFLQQDQHLYENDRLIDIVMQGKKELWSAMVEKTQLLQSVTPDDKRLSYLEEQIAFHDGYSIKALGHKLLEGLGIAQNDHEKPLSSLSGGYRLRILLAQVLFNEPDVLILDEPTNYLDIATISWLEDYLRYEFNGLLVFTSHDHDFLNNLATHILDVDFGEIRAYVGDYDHFVTEKQLLVEQKSRENVQLERKVADLQAFVDRFKAGTRSKQSKSRARQLEKIEVEDIKQSSRMAPYFNFKQKRPSGKEVLIVNKIEKSFGDRKVLHGVSFTINRGEKVAFVGRNGIGKSTLLNIIMDNKVSMDSGTYTWGYETQISYFTQECYELSKERSSVLDWLNNQVTSESSPAIRNALGQMLFTGDDVHQAVFSLSGGEKTRLIFAKMMLEKNNILVLDEPTNHLDLESREALAEALKAFDGTVLLVSHDRHFIAASSTRVVSLSEKGVRDFYGDYYELMQH